MNKEELLLCLKESDGYLSGEQISERFGVSRTAVWKGIKSLREIGCRIESVTNRGYRLLFVPDPLTVERIAGGLHTHRLGKHVFIFQEIDSTNEAAKREARQGAPDGGLFVSEMQTSGKGRLGRSWSAPAGEGLWFSLLLRHGFLPQNVSLLTLLAGLAVCRAVRAHTGLHAEIKWPNDVIVGPRKICGILTELAAEVERIEYVVVGIGINVNTPSFAEGLCQKATSIFLESGRRWDRVPLLQETLRQMEELLNRFERDGLPLEAYRECCATLGRKIGFTRNGLPETGTAEDVNGSGNLIVRRSDGTLFPVCSGEVTVQGIYGQGTL